MGALSKGCGSCKRRKVKCDETRPRCTRCCKAGVECTGFTPRLRFVDENPRVRRAMTVSHSQSHEFPTILKTSQLEANSTRYRQRQHLRLCPVIPKTIPLTAFKDDIFTSYLVSRLFEEEYRFPLKCGLPADWIPELVKSPQKPHQKSWNALAAAVFGQAHNNSDIVTKSLVQYGVALSELRNQISNPNDRGTDSTLASLTALYMFEILVYKNQEGWMIHADGLGQLLQWRGPWQQKFYSERSIFIEYRIILVAKSIISRQSTFLHDPIWKTVPWEDDPSSKSAINYLIDIGTEIAEYNAQIKLPLTDQSSQSLEHSQLRALVATSLGELNTWWNQWEAEHEQPAVKVTSHRKDHTILFPTLLEFDDSWTAYTFCVHNAMRILLLQLWRTLQPTSSIQTVEESVLLDIPNGTALLGITSDEEGLACEILQSLEYCFRQSQRFTYTFSFLFVQDVAYGCFRKGSKEAIWVAGHGWAQLGHSTNSADANLLKRLTPLGKIKAGIIV